MDADAGVQRIAPTSCVDRSDASTEFSAYGQSVAVSGNTIAVGAWGVGAVYVFLKPTTGWSTVNETAKLTASDVLANRCCVGVSPSELLASPNMSKALDERGGLFMLTFIAPQLLLK